jgi:nucleoside-diphosphate-sugar epimerase
MKWLESIKPYSQRTTDLRVIDAGEEADVKTYVIKAPRIYGRGTGLYNQKSVQIPILIRGAIAAGRVEYIGQGTGIWDDVHVVDVAAFFELLLKKILKNEHVPTGPKPFFFIQSLRRSWKELAEGLAVAGAKKGLLKSVETSSVELSEAAAKYTGGDTYLAEVGLASK